MRQTSSRIADAVIGVLFAGLAVTILAISDFSPGPALAALVVGGLGLQAVVSALRGRPSWLARIGPLP